jgi:hypothetical protein
MREGAVPLAWTARRYPLEPLAAVAHGAPALALAARLLARGDEELARLRGLAGADFLLVAGESGDLPWVDGVAYLGRDPDAPALLVPTALAPNAPVRLLERAFTRQRSSGGAPFAITVAPPACIPAGGARPIERARLAAWIERPPIRTSSPP